MGIGCFVVLVTITLQRRQFSHPPVHRSGRIRLTVRAHRSSCHALVNQQILHLLAALPNSALHRDTVEVGAATAVGGKVHEIAQIHE